ncbi:MAG: TRAP transporter small permease [Elusimicrobiota bacterium]|jgi:TRAP-type C4-dicarboxylate transport system permease small subunit|nr:TRAP transporter small permease [Elusimicrobiota bacterium]
MKKIYDLFCKVEAFVCGVGFLSLVAVIFLSAILRGFHVSMSWNIDVALLLLPWVSFLGADCAFRKDQLVGIDLFVRKLPAKLKIVVELIVLLLTFTLLVFLVYYGIMLTVSDWGRQYGSLPISFSWAVLSLPAASLSMAITAVLKITRGFKQLKSL